MLLIGVTGSIGMGKSTVAKMFTEYGFGLYNADDTVHYIYENDEEVINKIEESFPGTKSCLLYTSPSPRDGLLSRMPSSA